jgi:hypothetical protein
MRGHFSSEDVERFRARAMPPSELLAFYDHISDCTQCREAVNKVMQPQHAVASLVKGLTRDSSSEVEHLSYEQVEGYLDATLAGPEREMTSAHLELCPGCAARVDELRTFKNSLGRSKSDARSFWRPFSTSSRRPLGWLLVPAQVAIIAFVSISLATLGLRREIKQLQGQRDQLQQENAGLRKDAANAQELEATIERLQREQEETLATVADLQSRLQASQQLANGTGDHSLALNDNGRTIGVDKLGVVNGLGTLSARDERAVRAALSSQSLDAPADLAELAVNQSGLLRGGSEGVAFALVSPLGRVVENDRPVFHWTRLNGASSYSVSVFDRNFNRVAVSSPVEGTEWRTDVPLPRGGLYSWQVAATRGNETIKSPTTPAPEARFKVLDAAGAAELENARRDHHDSHLILGLVYTRSGLMDEAEREFKALLKANPRSPVAERLLRSAQRLHTHVNQRVRK